MMDVTHGTEQAIPRRPSELSSVASGEDPSYKWKVLASVVVGLFMVILDATVVNVALRSLQEKYAAFGVFGIVLVFAPASGPLLGGWLVDHNLIPWIFFINLPIGLLGLAVSGRFLRGGRGRRTARADLAGIILAPTGFGALLAALVVAELRAADPLLDLRLYRLRGFALGSAVGLIGTVAPSSTSNSGVAP